MIARLGGFVQGLPDRLGRLQVRVSSQLTLGVGKANMQSAMAIDRSHHASANEQPEPRAASELPEQPARVLVADDEHLVATGVANNLTELGFEVVGPVTSGDQAIALCNKQRPDIALLDIEMPGQSGIEVARILYDNFRIPVVIFSAYSDPDYVNDGNDAGVFGYLLKPVTQDQLRVGISVAWNRFRDAFGKSEAIDQLERRLDERKIVEQAKWIIVQRKHVTEPEAHRILQRQARNNRRPLIDVARSIIESDSVLSDD